MRKSCGANIERASMTTATKRTAKRSPANRADCSVVGSLQRNGAWIGPVCSCGWKGKRGQYGNQAGYGYLCAACGEEWTQHAMDAHGLTEVKGQIRIGGRLIATIVDRLSYRLRRERKELRVRFATHGYLIFEAVRMEATGTRY